MFTKFVVLFLVTYVNGLPKIQHRSEGSNGGFDIQSISDRFNEYFKNPEFTNSFGSFPSQTSQGASSEATGASATRQDDEKPIWESYLGNNNFGPGQYQQALNDPSFRNCISDNIQSAQTSSSSSSAAGSSSSTAKDNQVPSIDINQYTGNFKPPQSFKPDQLNGYYDPNSAKKWQKCFEDWQNKYQPGSPSASATSSSSSATGSS